MQMNLSMKQKQTQRYERGNLQMPGQDGEGWMHWGCGISRCELSCRECVNNKSYGIAQETVSNIL